MRFSLLAGVGIAQIISWGSLFYSIGVLGTSMKADLGIPDLFLYGSFTAGLFASGMTAPAWGRLIDQRGGRVVLSAGSVVAAIALVTLAVAPNGPTMLLGWLIAGVAMSAVLYDPAFATLSQHTGPAYRRSVTIVTLFGGFASTAFWPLSHVLEGHIGWRGTLLLYAAMHLAICLPIHLALVPKGNGPVREKTTQAATFSPTPRLRWLTLSFGLATFVFGVIAVHLIPMLTRAGLSSGEAVLVSMWIGPLQVAGRVIELAMAGRVRSVTVAYVAFGLMLAALGFLMATKGMGLAAMAFGIAYGCGNGLLTIVRGATPAELFGRSGLGAILGYMSRYAFMAKAVAPASFAALLAAGLTQNGVLAILALFAACAASAFGLASRGVR